MKLAANLSLLFPDTVPWAERCQRAAAQGFQYAEVLFPYDQPAAQYRQWLDEAGLQAMLINTPVDGHSGLAAVEGAQQQFRQDLDRAVDVAGELGAGLIHVMAGRSQPGSPLSLDCLLSNLEYALQRVEGTPVVLLLEALNRRDVPGYFYSQPDDVLKVLASLPSPQLRQQFDFYHTLSEDLPLLQELERCLPWIGHVQIAQPPTRCEPDLETGDMQAGLQRLLDADYQGGLGCEYRPKDRFEDGLGWLAPFSTTFFKS